MNLIFCNLSVRGIIGNSNILPRLLVDVLLPPPERLISYYECVVQALVLTYAKITAVCLTGKNNL